MCCEKGKRWGAGYTKTKLIQVSESNSAFVAFCYTCVSQLMWFCWHSPLFPASHSWRHAQRKHSCRGGLWTDWRPLGEQGVSLLGEQVCVSFSGLWAPVVSREVENENIRANFSPWLKSQVRSLSSFIYFALWYWKWNKKVKDWMGQKLKHFHWFTQPSNKRKPSRENESFGTTQAFESVTLSVTIILNHQFAIIRPVMSVCIMQWAMGKNETFISITISLKPFMAQINTETKSPSKSCHDSLLCLIFEKPFFVLILVLAIDLEGGATSLFAKLVLCVHRLSVDKRISSCFLLNFRLIVSVEQSKMRGYSLSCQKLLT